METGIKSVELALKRGVAKLLCCLDSWTGTTEPQLASLAKNLLLASSSEQAERLDGGGKMLRAAILEILEVSAVLNLALIPEDKMSRTLLWRQVTIVLHRENIHECIPDPERLCRYFVLGERADNHGVHPYPFGDRPLTAWLAYRASL